MKRVVCIILVVCFACSLFAWGRKTYITSSEEGHEVEDLLEDGLYKNQEQILTIAPVLTPEELALLYDENWTSPVKAPLLNGLVGFGSGSFGAGDKKGGTIQLCCELGGAVLGIASFGYFISSTASSIIGAIFNNQDKDNETIMGASAVGMVVGLGSFIAGRIYGIVRGIKYPLQYNNDLHDALYGTEPELQISFAPAVSPSGIGFGVGVSF